MTTDQQHDESPQATPAATAGQDPAELARERDQYKQEAEDLKDKYIRAAAEMENMRRRLDRERSEILKYGMESVFKDFLPTLDSLEKALPETGEAAPKTNGGKDPSYYEGMMIVKKQLLDVLRKHGLEPITAKGAAFDPNVHQAIQKLESNDVTTDMVGDEYARGYLLNGRLLRPAMVSVLTPSGS